MSGPPSSAPAPLGPRRAGVLDEIPPRYEHKFVVPQHIADAFRERVAPYSSLDSNSEASPDHRYDITSLYYDTPTLSLFEDTVNNVRKRYKLRIRRYGEKLGDSPVFFEVKHKVGDVIIKSRSIVPPLRWKKHLHDNIPADDPDATDGERDFRARVVATGARPTLLVRYAREAWKGGIDNYVRVTFDTKLCFAAVDHETLVTDAIWEAADDPVAFDDTGALTLIEVKFERTTPRWLAAAVRDLGMLRRGFSKYGTGIKRTFGVDGAFDVHRRVPTF